MSIWAQRVFPGAAEDSCDFVQGVFAEMFRAMGSPSNMLLLSVETSYETRLIAELPHAVLLHGLEGFERIDAANVPVAGELVVGWEDHFERQFRYQAAPVS